MPQGFSLRLPSYFSRAVGLTIGAAMAIARFLRKGVDAATRVMTTVVSSLASTVETPLPSDAVPKTKEA